MLVIAPVGYATSHFALGYLRLKGGNAAICAVSTVSALCRCSVVWLIATHPSWSPYLPDLLLLVEGSYGTMLLGAYLLCARRPCRRRASPAALRQLVSLGGKELISSWYSNAIFSGAKHLDVIIAAMLLGPAGAALYRGAKSVHNLAFNLGQALALVLHSRMRAWFLASRNVFPLLALFTLGQRLCVACVCDALRLQDQAISHGKSWCTLKTMPVSLADLYRCRAYVRLPDHLYHGVFDQQTVIPHPLDHGGRRLTRALCVFACSSAWWVRRCPSRCRAGVCWFRR